MDIGVKERQQIIIDEKIIYPAAEKRFEEICGLAAMEQGAGDRLRREGRTAYVRDFAEAGLRAVIGKLSAASLDSGVLRAGRQVLSCKFLAQIRPAQVEKIYLYVLTAGEAAPFAKAEERNSLDKLCADIFGTALLDAGRDYLEKQFRADAGIKEEDKDFCLEISPGFYGMDMGEARTIAELLSAEAIGVSLCGNLLLPEKSCAGIYLALKKRVHMDSACRTCAANRTGCRFCRMRTEFDSGE